MPWGIVLRQLAQSWASTKVRETVQQAAHSHKEQSQAANQQADNAESSSTSAEVTQSVDPAPNPFANVDIGIVCALNIEAGCFTDRLGVKTNVRGNGFEVVQGFLGKRPIAVMLCGVGAEAAQRGCEALLAGHHPRWVISAGFAGGLQPQIKRGDLVLATQVQDPGGRQLAIDFKGSLPPPPGLAIHTGKLLTSERILASVAEKQATGQSTGALAVEMETMVVATVCAAAGQRFLSLRVISDAMDEEVPRDVEKLIAAKTGVQRAGTILGGLFRRPSLVKDLWRLQEQALVSAENLAKGLETLIAALP
jgi:adenosylhomocysteine nucleosidase